MNNRINVSLPAETVAVLDQLAGKGNRSALIDRAIRQFIKSQSRQNLRERLKQEALANAERDLHMAAQWFPLEEEAWRARRHPKKRRR
jgi:CopG family transcriptional regulator/antitoxin EndoAI